MMENTTMKTPLHVSNTTYALKSNQNAHPLAREKAPLTQALNHIEMEMQQQQEEPDLVRKAFVSHVPVSIGSSSRSSSSTLSLLSWKEGLENEDMLPISEKSSNKLSVVSVGNASDVSCGSSSTNSGSRCAPLPSSITTRPAKKARTISNDSSNPISFTTDVRFSIAPPQSVSLPSQQQHTSLLLLAQDEDKEHLNPLHVFIRKQIEVFTATPIELAQPAPGRKLPIQLHQVGIRCIHCRNSLSNGGKKARVKRAVCYPSTVGKIYSSVSDMKFDHFTNCTKLPPEVRKTFDDLKAGGKLAQKEKQLKNGSRSNRKGQSSSSTAQYYRDSASRMGLVDSPGGIIYMDTPHAYTAQHRSDNKDIVSPTVTAPRMPLHFLEAQSTASSFLQQHLLEEYRKHLVQQQSFIATNKVAVSSMLFPPMQTSRPDLNSKHLTTTMNAGILQSFLMNAMSADSNLQQSRDATAIDLAKQQQATNILHPQQNPLKRPYESSPSTQTTAPGPAINIETETETETSAPIRKITAPLAAPQDGDVLNPIHCFVRKHVELFSADHGDIAAPCPGRKTRVALGQVGIRCKHCANLKIPLKKRVKRTVCYPPSIDGIYHSVSNMKFDHFGICPGLPPAAKEELASLRTSCRGRSTHKFSNTAQYYRDSAVAKGLVDTGRGIRFVQPCNTTTNDTALVTVTAPVTTPVIAAHRKSPQHDGEKRSNVVSMTPVTPFAAPPSVAKLGLSKFPTGLSALMMAAASHATEM